MKPFASSILAVLLVSILPSGVLSAQQSYELTGSRGFVDSYARTYYYPTEFSPAVNDSKTETHDTSPFLTQSLQASTITDRAFADASVAFDAQPDRLAFSASANSQYQGFQGSVESISTSRFALELNFELTQASLLEVGFDFYRTSFGTDFYSLVESFGGNTTLALQSWNGTTWDNLYRVSSVDDRGLVDNMGMNDGLFYSGLADIGEYRIMLEGSAAQGATFADGYVRVTPVPEPSGAVLMLVAAGVLLAGRKRGLAA